MEDHDLGHYLDNLMPSDHSDEGFIYILTNDAMPYITKLGLTFRNPDVRARELSRPTGVPLDYNVYKWWYVTEMRLVEKLCHQFLIQHRVNPRREHFWIDAQEQHYECEESGLVFNLGREHMESLVDALTREIQSSGYVFQEPVLCPQNIFAEVANRVRERRRSQKM